MKTIFSIGIATLIGATSLYAGDPAENDWAVKMFHAKGLQAPGEWAAKTNAVRISGTDENRQEQRMSKHSKKPVKGSRADG